MEPTNAAEETLPDAKHGEEAPWLEDGATAGDTPEKHGITPRLAQVFIERYLSVAKPKVTSHQYWPIATLGEGYTTVRKVLEINYEDEESGKEGTALFVVKLSGGPLGGSDLLGVVRDMGLYEREVVMYGHVVEHFRTIIRDKGGRSRLPFARFVYGTMFKDGEMVDDGDRPLADQSIQREMLVIEKLDDFEVVDKKVGLGLEHMRIMMPALARFHAIGYIMYKKHPEKANRLRQIKFGIPEWGMERMAILLRPVCSLLRHEGMPSEADALARLLQYERVQKGFNNTYTEDRDVVTIVHGDLWIGNMMFRFETDSNGVRTPVDIRFLDMQMSQFGDLANDFVYSFITSARRETRRYIRKMLTWYVQAFRDQLEDLGYNADRVAPWLCVDRLLEMYAKALEFNFMIGLQILTLLLSAEEDREEMIKATDLEAMRQLAQKLSEKWEKGGCPAELTARIVEFTEDLRQFGLI